MNKPKLSVVMSVYNAAHNLDQTIQGVLNQSFTNFEFIIIDDGSSDNSAEIVDSYQTLDNRVTLISQENQGLTKALITGCSLAKGEFIARQDAGDLSLAGRFTAQIQMFDEHRGLAMVSSGTQFITPNNEVLYTVLQSATETNEGLSQTSISSFRGPSHHGSVMFKRDIYERVGGYRAVFTVAQDIDLWSRMIEHGGHISTDKTYYRATLEKGAISIVKREQQQAATQLVLECARARAVLGSDQTVLTGLSGFHSNSSSATMYSDSAYYYFLASNLLAENPQASIKYLRKTLHANPLHLRARLKLILLRIRLCYRRR